MFNYQHGIAAVNQFVQDAHQGIDVLEVQPGGGFVEHKQCAAGVLEIIAKFAYMKLIEMNLQRILDLCRKHKVKTLSVFGSILTDRFNDQSDVDLLVDFEPIDHDTFDYVGNYFDLKDSLEELFNRKVDLIEYGKNLNPIFKVLVDKNKQLIYG